MMKAVGKALKPVEGNAALEKASMTLSSLNKLSSFTWFGVVLISVGILSQYSYVLAQEIIEPIRGSELRKNLLNTVRVKVEQELQTKILFKVEELRTNGQWAFLSAIPVTQNLTQIDYAKTKFAKQFEQGMFDNSLTALLLKEQGEKWNIIEFSLGSTDASFVDWPQKHLVPEHIVISE